MAEKEYIEREAAINAMCRLCSDTTRDKCSIQDICNHVCRLEAVPAADARPVVLCKDCKHKGWVQEPEHGKSVDYCRLIERCVDKQFFCAAGERKPTA